MSDPKHDVVLLIEDEPQTRRFLRAAITASGYGCLEAATGAAGLAEAAARNPAVILLDLGLPDIDGLEVMRRLRSWTPTPVIVLSARDQQLDKVEALDAGADDYLTKPFAVPELLARIRVAIRHKDRQAGMATKPVVSFGDVRVELAERKVTIREEALHLTPTQFKLLAVLVRHAGKVVTHGQLLDEALGRPAHDAERQYLRVYMGQLRSKLEPDPARPRFLITELGVGYRLQLQEEVRFSLPR